MNILESFNNKNKDNMLSLNKIDENFNLNSYNYILESEKELNTFKKNMYLSITEGVGKSILEGVFRIIRNIILRFINFLAKQANNFRHWIFSFDSNTAYIGKLKNKIDEFKHGDEKDVMGYVYTFSEDIPYAPSLCKWTECNEKFSIDDINKILNNSSIDDDEKFNKIIEYKKTFKSSSGTVFYDKFRGKVLNKTYEITGGDFNDELKKIFRSGKLEETKIHVDKQFLENALTFIEGYKNICRSIKTTKTNIEKEYKELENSMNKLIQHSGSDKIDAQVNIIMKDRADQIQNMCSIHALTFSAKLQAYKDCFDFYQKAPSSFNKDKYKNKEDK